MFDSIYKGSVMLAPMESITDLPFRLVCKELGADVVFSEFIASEALIRDARRSLEKLLVDEREKPVGIQIFGGNPESMLKSAKIVQDSEADFLDINFGCWVKKVVNNDAGAALLKNPAKFVEIAHLLSDSLSIPVTVKTRLGWDPRTINIVEIAAELQKTKIAGLTVHCRTRDMGMKGNADWSWISKIRAVFQKPLVLNGDIKSYLDAKRALEETPCDSIMIGRAAIGNPFIFTEIKKYLETGKEPEPVSLEERIRVCLRHLELNIDFKGFPRGFLEFRKHYSGYIKGYRNASSLRQKLVIAPDVDSVKKLLDEFIEEQKNYPRLDELTLNSLDN